MLLNVLSRDGDGCAAMRKLIHDCHETPKQKKAHTQRAWQLFRSLLDRKIVEFINPRSAAVPAAGSSAVSPREAIPGGTPGEPAGADACATGSGRKLRVNVELQEDFSMDQVLSLYLLETIPLMDPQAPDYALVLLTLVESILEDPDIILRKQLDKVKDRKMAEMKAEGIEYDQRMEELEKLRTSQAEPRVCLFHVQRFRRAASVGGRGKHPLEIHRAGNVRGIPLVRRLHQALRIAARRGRAAAASEQRFQSARADRARHRQERSAPRNGTLSRHDDPAGGFQPAR